MRPRTTRCARSHLSDALVFANGRIEGTEVGPVTVAISPAGDRFAFGTHRRTRENYNPAAALRHPPQHDFIARSCRVGGDAPAGLIAGLSTGRSSRAPTPSEM